MIIGLKKIYVYFFACAYMVCAELNPGSCSINGVMMVTVVGQLPQHFLTRHLVILSKRINRHHLLIRSLQSGSHERMLPGGFTCFEYQTRQSGSALPSDPGSAGGQGCPPFPGGLTPLCLQRGRNVPVQNRKNPVVSKACQQVTFTPCRLSGYPFAA